MKGSRLNAILSFLMAINRWASIGIAVALVGLFFQWTDVKAFLDGSDDVVRDIAEMKGPLVLYLLIALVTAILVANVSARIFYLIFVYLIRSRCDECGSKLSPTRAKWISLVCEECACQTVLKCLGDHSKRRGSYSGSSSD